MEHAHPIRIGVVGCGSVMQSYMALAEKLRCQGRLEVIIACDVVEARRDYMRQTHGIERLTADYDDVVQADDVDLVLILTSMCEHGPIARAALEAGKHVLVEKPMAVTLEEAAHIVELAKTSPGYLLCAPHVILSDTYQAIWRHMHAGEIGEVVSARARYGWAGPDWAEWFYRPGGGSLFDLGVYNVTSLTGLFGPAQRVMAMTGIAVPERMVKGRPVRVETEDNAHVMIDFGAARYAVTTTGFNMQRYRCPAIELYGTEGTLQMLGDDWAPEGYEMWLNSTGTWQVFGESNRAWPWTDGLRHIVECIQAQRRPIITPEHAYHVLEIMLKAKESGRDGQSKLIESKFTPPTFAQDGEALAAHRVHAPRR
jgi:predicted dehydrogenase